MKKAINIIAILILTANIFGQSPDAFKYQAIVRDNAGAVIANKSVEIQISILQGTISGLAVFNETHTSKTNQFGQVNLEIGNGTNVSGSLSTINWANGPYFIKVLVNGTEIGITPLLSVPYAKYADKAGNGFSGDYNDLTNKPDKIDQSWASITGKPIFSKVATSGSYNDLSDLPAIFDGNWSSLKGVPNFAKIATTGSYTDLTNRPSIFSGNYNDLTNKPIWTWDLITGRPTFATVAFSGKYTDLLNLPMIFNGNWSSLTGTPTTIVEYGITDAMTKGNAANAITSNQIANWNAAYGWGDHSTKGYAVATFYYTKLNLQTSGGSSVHWGNIINKPTTILGYGISDFSISSPSENQLLKYNDGNGKWENWTPNFTVGNQQLLLEGTILAISGSGGNAVSFAGWDTNNADDFTINTSQTITGNKTFSGTITVATINANNGLNANSKNITNVAEPTANSDAATKTYADVLKDQIIILQNKIIAIEQKLGL